MELDFSKVNQTTFTTHGMDGNYDTEGDNQVITYQFDKFRASGSGSGSGWQRK